MSEAKTGAEVVAQSKDTSLMNTDPLVAKAAVVGVVSSILIALAAFGLITEEQRTIIIEQVGNIVFGLFVIMPIIVAAITGLWGRVSAYSPRTAAEIAVENAEQPQGAPPTLLPPP